MERKLPIINIEGTEFYVDAIREELRERANTKNVLQMDRMSYVGDGYKFDYDPVQKNHFNYNFNGNFSDEGESVRVWIPELARIDPVGMCKKYGLDPGEINQRSDFELMVTEGPLHLRWNRKILPTLEIEGHTFYVDLDKDRLRPKDDFQSTGIVLSQIRDYYDRGRQAYLIPYNPRTHTFQEVDHLSITEIPEEIVIVQFPHEHELDRVGWNRKHGFDIRRGTEDGLQLQFTSRTLDWRETNIPDSIMRNRKEKGLPPHPGFAGMQAPDLKDMPKRGRSM